MNKKLITLALTGALILGTTVVANASPASVYADLVGVTEQEAIELSKESELNLAELAENDGLLTEFKSGILAEMIERINQHVTDGKLTQEDADAKIESITDEITNAEAADMVGKGKRGEHGFNEGHKRAALATILEEQFDGDLDALKADMIARNAEKLIKAVENDKLTQEEADTKLTEITTEITNATLEELETNIQQHGSKGGNVNGGGLRPEGIRGEGPDGVSGERPASIRGEKPDGVSGERPASIRGERNNVESDGTGI